jgi:isochorismate hydrolase
MVIPTVAGYAMPTEADVPRGAARWRPDPTRAVLLVHDMQRYFVGFLPVGRSPTTDQVANIARARKAANALHVPVVYTAQPGGMTPERRGLLYDMWGPGMSAHPRDRSIVDELAPDAADVVLEKFRYSAFHGTELATRLATWRRDQLIVCGVFAHIGCLLTACDAFCRDLETFFVADAMADFSRREHLMAVDYAARTCAVPTTTDRLVRELAWTSHSTGYGPARPARPSTRCRAS